MEEDPSRCTCTHVGDQEDAPGLRLAQPWPSELFGKETADRRYLCVFSANGCAFQINKAKILKRGDHKNKDTP